MNKPDELLDIVDENDRVIGQAYKSELHQRPDLIHHTVHFTLVDKMRHKVLITLRSHKKQFDAGKLCFLGEHMLAGETYDQAIVRGVQEELDFIPINCVYVSRHLLRLRSQTEIVRFYLIGWNNEELRFDKDEIESFQWLTLDKLKQTNPMVSEVTQYWIDHTDWEKYL